MSIEPIVLHPIGVVRSAFAKPTDAPIQAAGAGGAEGTIEIFPEHAEGLADLAGFSHLIVLYRFHRITKTQLTVVPFLDTDAHGVFATRSPARPNALGLSVLRLLRVDGVRLHVQDVDMIDGTPVLDLKPFVPQFDHRSDVRIGWFEGKVGELQGRKADDRFS